VALTEKPNGVIPELEQKTPKRKSNADRDLYLDLEADSEADLEADSEVDVDAIIAPNKVDKGKAKAINLPNSLNENPTPKVCYDFIAQ